jgi:hypothetical protein
MTTDHRCARVSLRGQVRLGQQPADLCGWSPFLVEQDRRRILIDAGSGDSLGPDTGYLAANLYAAGIDPDDIDPYLEAGS